MKEKRCCHGRKAAVPGRMLCMLLVMLLAAGCFAGERAYASEDGTAEPEYVEKTVVIDFADSENDDLTDTDLMDFFMPEVIPEVGGFAVVTENDELKLNSYATFYTDIDSAYDYFARPYTFSLDYRLESGDSSLSGIFVRCTDPHAYTITNPKNQSVQQAFSFYEWDWYRENGGAAPGESSIGGSGIKLSEEPGASKLSLAVKTREEDGLRVYSRKIMLDLPEGFKKGEMNNYKFTDDCAGELKIFVNDVLLCTVEYGGEPSGYPDGDDGDSTQLFYKHVDVKDPAGNVLLTLDNARISAEYSVIALGSRGNGTVSYVDNVSLTYLQKKKAPTPVPTEAPAATATKEPVSTVAPAATAKPAGEKTGIDPTVWIYVGCGVVVVAALAAVIVSAAKKKKK